MLKDYKRIPQWMIKLVLFLLIALPVRYTIERMKPFDKIDRNPAWVQELKELNSEKIKNGVLFNYKGPIEAMFYTNLTAAYPNIPDKATITTLLQKNYTIIIDDNGKIPKDIYSMQGIIKRKFLPPVL